jgi:xylan 1,4-beta-xylosidase
MQLRTVLGVALLFNQATSARCADAFPVGIRVEVAKPQGELKRIWRFFGADEPNYAYLKDGRKLVGELGSLAPKQVYFRAHNLLNTGDGTPALKWGSTVLRRVSFARQPGPRQARAQRLSPLQPDGP